MSVAKLKEVEPVSTDKNKKKLTEIDLQRLVNAEKEMPKGQMLSIPDFLQLSSIFIKVEFLGLSERTSNNGFFVVRVNSLATVLFELTRNGKLVSKRFLHRNVSLFNEDTVKIGETEISIEFTSTGFVKENSLCDILYEMALFKFNYLPFKF